MLCHGFSLVDSLSSYPSPNLTFAPSGQLEDTFAPFGAAGGLGRCWRWDEGASLLEGGCGVPWDPGGSTVHT